MPNGNFWVGAGGFNYKRSSGAGGRRNFSLGAITNQPADVNNKYVPGAGVGASSISNRRARLIRSTSCTSTYPCNRSFARLGLQHNGNGNNYAVNWYLNDGYPLTFKGNVILYPQSQGSFGLFGSSNYQGFGFGNSSQLLPGF